jgi:pimeloyl-ACP methyl ester carboxylesterase
MKLFQSPMLPYPGLEAWSHQAQLPGCRLALHYYDTGGAKTPMLLVHGLGDDADTWHSLIPLLKDRYRVIAPDLPGYGRSDKDKRKYGMPLFTSTLLELMDVLSLPPVVLVGHSMGAMIAQALTLQHPEKVERLVLVSGSLAPTGSRIDASLLLFLIPGVGEWMYNRLRKSPQAAYATLTAYYNHLETLPQAERDFLYQRVNQRVWSDGQRDAYLSTLRSLAAWLPAQQKTLPARLSAWKTPLRVVWGENDRINPAANAHALIQLLPSARLVIVPGAGHNIQQEQAQALAEEIL